MPGARSSFLLLANYIGPASFLFFVSNSGGLQRNSDDTDMVTVISLPFSCLFTLRISLLELPFSSPVHLCWNSNLA